MVDDNKSADDLDDMLLSGGQREFPPQRDHSGWLHVSQVTLTNLRHLINHGKSETAEKVLRTYWQRWSEARDDT